MIDFTTDIQKAFTFFVKAFFWLTTVAELQTLYKSYQ